MVVSFIGGGNLEKTTDLLQVTSHDGNVGWLAYMPAIIFKV